MASESYIARQIRERREFEQRRRDSGRSRQEQIEADNSNSPEAIQKRRDEATIANAQKLRESGLSEEQVRNITGVNEVTIVESDSGIGVNVLTDEFRARGSATRTPAANLEGLRYAGPYDPRVTAVASDVSLYDVDFPQYGPRTPVRVADDFEPSGAEVGMVRQPQNFGEFVTSRVGRARNEAMFLNEGTDTREGRLAWRDVQDRIAFGIGGFALGGAVGLGATTVSSGAVATGSRGLSALAPQLAFGAVDLGIRSVRGVADVRSGRKNTIAAVGDESIGLIGDFTTFRLGQSYVTNTVGLPKVTSNFKTRSRRVEVADEMGIFNPETGAPTRQVDITATRGATVRTDLFGNRAVSRFDQVVARDITTGETRILTNSNARSGDFTSVIFRQNRDVGFRDVRGGVVERRPFSDDYSAFFGSARQRSGSELLVRNVQSGGRTENRFFSRLSDASDLFLVGQANRRSGGTMLTSDLMTPTTIRTPARTSTVSEPLVLLPKGSSRQNLFFAPSFNTAERSIIGPDVTQASSRPATRSVFDLDSRLEFDSPQRTVTFSRNSRSTDSRFVLDTFTATDRRSIVPQAPPKPPRSKTPPPPIIPVIPVFGPPGLGGNSGSKKRRKGKKASSKRSSKKTPSLLGIGGSVRGSKDQDLFTGLEVRL